MKAAAHLMVARKPKGRKKKSRALQFIQGIPPVI